MITTQPIIDTFIQTVPKHLREASLFCAAPSWFQEPLALKIIENFVVTEFSAQDTFYQLLNLPFVYRHDETTWQYTDSARTSMLSTLAAEDYKAVNRLVATDLKSQLETLLNAGHADLPDGDEQTDSSSWQVRRLRWQLIYHLAPVDPQQAYDEFEVIAKWASRRSDRLPMYKLAIETWQKQAKWLNAYVEEGDYYQGRYAYTLNDYARAENLFNSVWRGDTKNMLMKADAGHLLGVIYRRKGQNKWTKEAEEMLRASLEIVTKEQDQQNEEIIRLKARIFNSLGATLIQAAARITRAQASKKLEEAETVLFESLRLQEEVFKDNQGSAHTLNTLATLFLQYEGTASIVRAREYIEKALLWSSQSGHDRDESVHLNTKAEVLIQTGNENSLSEAEDLLHRALELNRNIRDKPTQAISLYRLARVLKERGDEISLHESKRLLYQSLKLWRELGNSMRQKDNMELIADVWKQLNEPEKASSMRRRAYQLVD